MNKVKRKNHPDNAPLDRLSSEDYQLYLKLHQSLLTFVCQKLDPDYNLKTRADFLKLTLEDKFRIRNDLMKNIYIIDEFVKSNPCNFTVSELDIIKSWKNHVNGTFFVVNYTKDGAIFMEEAEKDPKAYLVLALETPLWEIVPILPPVRVAAVLLPFKGRIVYDGMINADRIFFGSEMARSVKAISDRAIMEHGLVKSLPYKSSVTYSAEEKLIFYLSTKESREMHLEEITDLMRKNKDLLPTYLMMMGRANSRSLKKRLKDVGVKRGWFAIADDVIVASSKTRDDLERLVENIIPNHGKDSVYIFEFK